MQIEMKSGYWMDEWMLWTVAVGMAVLIWFRFFSLRKLRGHTKKRMRDDWMGQTNENTKLKASLITVIIDCVWEQLDCIVVYRERISRVALAQFPFTGQTRTHFHFVCFVYSFRFASISASRLHNPIYFPAELLLLFRISNSWLSTYTYKVNQ